MDTSDAQKSLKKVTRDASSLNPTAILSLFEIDITDLLKNNERSLFIEGDGGSAYRNPSTGKTILRFHNNIKLFRSSIFFNSQEYLAAPIQIDGYEISAKGSPPTPKMSITIDPEGLTQEMQNRIVFIKTAIRDLDDLVGSKVTRIRTFTKYIDNSNFYDADGNLLTNILNPPQGFDPDPNAQFPPDIYFVDRKSAETKNVMELELASPFDTQDLKLPARVVNDFNCPWTYRGEGCCYEWNQQKNATDSIYDKPDNVSHENSNLDCKSTPNPTPKVASNPNGAAPPVATHNNELIKTILNVDAISVDYENGVAEEWNSNTVYPKGHVARIKVKGVNYYFVSKGQIEGVDNKGKIPPNDNFWVADQCSKTVEGCRIRWANNPELGELSGPLPFGGFPTSRRAID